MALSRVKISIVTPAAMHARSGNRTTAARWSRLLRELGHEVVVEQQWRGGDADIMIALHARKSHESIARFSTTFPGRPLIVALTGTDLYRDIDADRDAQESLALATRLIVLQELGVKALPTALRGKARVVYQSARAVPRPARLASCFEVSVSGHLRDEKDPFRTAAALRFLPPESRIRVTHFGAALSREFAREARGWMARERRYLWLGEVAQWRALRLLGRSRVTVVSSRMEGGANVVSEAFANRVPVLASRIPGNVGMLGARYPGYFATADAQGLARLLTRAESDRSYYQLLVRACAARAELTDPERERGALAALLGDALGTRAARPRRRLPGAA